MLPPWPGDGSLEGDSPEPHVLWVQGPSAPTWQAQLLLMQYSAY